MGQSKHTFIDLFAGCGGLSLGLAQAGLVGRFAVERDEMAFGTLAHNFLDRTPPTAPFRWPRWLVRKNWSIEELLHRHQDQLQGLRGKVDVLAGGPPCQGFSFAGRRQEDDPRNLLFEKYLEFVEIIQPAVVLLENVPGMRIAHALKVVEPGGPRRTGSKPPSYYDRLEEKLRALGYSVLPMLLNASRFGVPQKRERLVVFGLRQETVRGTGIAVERFRDLLEEARIQQLCELGLPEAVSASAALSDLETTGSTLIPTSDSWSGPGFKEISYKGPATAYQRLMNDGLVGSPNSSRLARHNPKTASRFTRILTECRKGVRMDDESRRAFGLKKQRIFPMAPELPAPTVTTLPEDILHYSEPRILTVRECARLQSFPDWFEFTGKFTTGGDRRTRECPRYTQVGNAVPPYLGRALGLATRCLLIEIAVAKTDAPRGTFDQVAISA